MSRAHRCSLILSIVQTDCTFSKTRIQQELYWVGRCIFCRAKLVVPLDGDAGGEVTIEHICPRNHGGDDDPHNLALACSSCNAEKGMHHDNKSKNDPRRQQIVQALREQREARWREAPADDGLMRRLAPR